VSAWTNAKRNDRGANPRWLAGALALGLIGLALTGCASYELRGKVIRGDASRVELVEADDQRLEQRGLGGAKVLVTLDPQSLDNERIGAGQSGGRGGFALPVDVLGPGFLQHEVQIAVVKSDYETAARIMSLPPKKKRVLITLSPGRSTPPKRKGDVLDETLEMGEPYLDRPEGATP
jgi:hypothetical protein